jgi:F-type H+-transporting ATPase subunit b
MLSPLLLLASATATEPAGAASGITKLFDQFGIDLPLFLAQVVCVSVVIVVLWKFAFKPVLATIDERQRQIQDGLRYTEEMKAKLAQTQQESAGLIKQAQAEGARFIEEARRVAKELGDRQQKEASARAEDLIVKAQQAMELEHKRMMEEARTEVARLVVATTQRVLAKELNDVDRTRYTAAAARELVEMKS